MSSVLIAGDFASRKYEFEESLNASSEVAKIVSSCDYSILNLEAPVYNAATLHPIPKQGPSLLCNEKCLDVIKSVGFDAVTLANNHIYDYGQKALEFTISSLTKRQIDYVGAGADEIKASNILTKQIGGDKFSIINCCEHEFSVATHNHGGANAFDPIKLYYLIQEKVKKTDYVIVIIHGGVEHFEYPTPRMVKEYRFLIDAGAHAVINHHQHCPCGYENYKGRPIFYGLGNFFFPWDGKLNSSWNLGYMTKLRFDKGNVGVEMVKYQQCNNDLGVNLLEGKDLEAFDNKMKHLCTAIHKEEVLMQKLREFNEKNVYLYKKMIEPYSGRIMNALYSRGLLPSFIGKEKVLALIDFLGCESHYERVMDFLNNKYKQF